MTDTPTPRDQIEQAITEEQAALAADQAALSQLPPDPTPSAPVVIVPAGGNLQAALDVGGIVQLVDGATYYGNFVVDVPGTRLSAPTNAFIVGADGAPALFIPPGASDIQIANLTCTSAWDQSVVMVGNNDSTQTQASQAPTKIVLTNIQVPTHRGKRAFYLNAGDTQLLNCGCLDVYDPSAQDSQGICILNGPGPVLVSGGTYVAASENILVGGDVVSIPDVVPTGLTFEGLTLSKPAAWRTAPPPGGVKNNFELKNGTNVVLKNSTLDGCWQSGQAGFSIQLTPRNGGTIANVLIQDVIVQNVDHGINLLAEDDSAYSPPMVGVTFERVTVTAVGRFLDMAGAFQGVVVDSCTFTGGDNTIYGTPSVTWSSPTTQGPQGWLSKGVKVTNNHLACNSYGIMLASPLPMPSGAVQDQAYGQNWQAAWPDGVITGNTFVGSTAALMAKNLPATNTFAAA